jgi:hypothetical protein
LGTCALNRAERRQERRKDRDNENVEKEEIKRQRRQKDKAVLYLNRLDAGFPPRPSGFAPGVCGG